MTISDSNLTTVETQILSALYDQRQSDGIGWGLGNPLYFRQKTGFDKGQVEYALAKLVEKGYLNRVNRGLYQLDSNFNFALLSDMTKLTASGEDRPHDPLPEKVESLGTDATQVYTPERIARFITDWAVHESETSGDDLPRDFYAILYDSFIEAESTLTLVTPTLDLQVLEDVAQFAQDSRNQVTLYSTASEFKTFDEYEQDRFDDIFNETSLISFSQLDGPVEPQIVIDGIISIGGKLPFTYNDSTVDSSQLNITHDYQQIATQLEEIGISVERS